MTIEAKIIAHSVHALSGKDIITYSLRFPRFILPEMNTHKMLSKNASSSRAIPVKKQISLVREDMAIPIAFAANKAGMQARETFGPFKQWLSRVIWRSAGYSALFFATLMDKLNIHKQYANRIMEPYAHISVVITGTDWDNFFALRFHGMAQPEFAQLAKQMYYAKENSIPKVLKVGEWHLPYVSEDEKCGCKFSIDELLKMSAARCARVSYLTHEGKTPIYSEDEKLFIRLVGSQPIHASPTEHQAQVAADVELKSGNFNGGWIQHRKLLPNENITKFDLEAALASFN